MADRDVTVRLRADVAQYQRALATAAAETSAFGKQADRSGREVDKLSGRLRIAADAALIFGPALGTLGAAAVGGIVALSAQLGAAAGALGVTLLAVNGLGDGLKALDAYQLQPTAANLAKLNEEMEKLGPSGEHFVRFLDRLEPDLKSLQTAARDGLLPGAEEGITALLDRLPELRGLVRGIADELGDLSAGAGKALAGERFDSFFEYLRTDGIAILDDTAKTAGNLAETVANLFAAFGGLSTDFSGGLLKFSEGLAEASANLDSSAGFQEFVRYIETEGPHALETIESLGNAFLQIVEATAPLGGPVLTIIGKFADAVAKVADSDIGTPLFAGLAALALLNRSMAVTSALQTATFGGPAVAKMKGYVVGLGTVVTAQDRARMSAAEMDAANAAGSRSLGKFAIPAAGIAASMTGVADSVGLSNTAMLAVAGPWGAAAGAILDLKAAYDGLNDSIDSLDAATASGDIDVLVQKIADTKAQLADLESTSTQESVAKNILGGVGLGIFADPQDEIGMMTGKTGQLRDSLAAAEAELAGLRDGSLTAFNPVHSLASAISAAAQAAMDETDALHANVDAMRAKRSEALRALDAELNYQAAIDDARKSLKENGKQFDITTEKGRANRQSLYALADGWNQQSDAAKNAKGSLQAARQNFIETATEMGATAVQAKRLADRLFEIPPKRKTEITVESGAAEAALSRLNAFQFDPKVIQVRVEAHGASGGGGFPAEGGAGRVAGSGRTSGRTGLPRGLVNPRTSDLSAAGNNYALHALDGLARQAQSAGGRLKTLKERLAEAEKAIERETSKRDELISAQQAFMSAVGGAYSKADLFGGGLSDFDIGLAANTNDTNAAQAALAAAAANGLDGPLYQALAQSGNLTLLQEFAGLSAGDIDIREHQFANQSAAQAGLGASAADAAGFTAAIKDLNKDLRDAQKERRELKQAIKSLEDKLPGRVEDGARRGIAEREKRTQAHVRAGR